MADFFELEKKCKKLKQKKIIKYSVVGVGIIVIFVSIILYFFLEQTTSQKKDNIKKVEKKDFILKKPPHHEELKKVVKEVKKVNTPQQPPKKVVKVVKKENNNSVKKVKKMEKNITKKVVVNSPKIIKQNSEIKEVNLTLDINFSNIKSVNNPQKNIDKKTIKVVKTKNAKTTSTSTSTKKSVLTNEVITFSKAIKLAEDYYENGDYQTSIKWCKLASKIDNNDERVWKIYALDLEKLGQKERAIKILETYLKYKNSLDLKYLLQRLKE